MSNNNIIYSERMPVFLNEALHEPEKLSAKIEQNIARLGLQRVSKNEVNSWKESLPQMAELFEDEVIANDQRIVLVELRIPTGQMRVDFALLGETQKREPAAFIIELKQWTSANIKERSYNNFWTGNYLAPHPSFQAENYRYTLDEKLGLKTQAALKAAAYLHNFRSQKHELYHETYAAMLQAAFSYNRSTRKELYQAMTNHISVPNGERALAILSNLRWNPTNSFLDLVAKENKAIVLGSSQQFIFDQIRHYVHTLRKENQKQTFIIKGNPGSGKSIMAFKLLHELQTTKYPVQLMLPGGELRASIKKIMQDKKLMAHISGSIVKKGYRGAIIDEAHKAISRDVGLINYQKMYQDLDFAVILIDDAQVINKKGIAADDVRKIAEASGHAIQTYEIEENYRNQGEVALLNWIDLIFYGKSSAYKNAGYEQSIYPNATHDYKLYGYASDDTFVNTYYQYYENPKTKTRIASLWHAEWYTGSASKSGDLPPHINIGKYGFAWNPNSKWLDKLKEENPEAINSYHQDVIDYAKNDESFILGHKALKREYVAYFNHVQGSEFDHIFVYIPKVFTYEDKQIVFHRERLAKEVISSQTWSYKNESSQEQERRYQLNKTYFLNRIKVMLTRGTKSTHVYAEDRALNEYINSKIIP